MKLLTVIGTLDPRYGGPVEALRQLVWSLGEVGVACHVLTLDGPNSPWLRDFPGLIETAGPSVGKYRYTSKLVPWLLRHGKAYDAVVGCGIWQYQSFAIWRASRIMKLPYFIFVHGALDPWFKQAFPLKHVKKWLYWPWAEYRVLRDARAVLFRTEEERLLARQSFWLYRANEAVVTNGIREPSWDAEKTRDAFLSNYPELRDKRLFLFLSRLDKKKGCDELVDGFALVAHRDSHLHLVVAGPGDPGTKRRLQKIAADNGIADRITFTGMLEGELKDGAYRSAEIFILPSHSENFGMVVVEALARGLPVVISNKVNIWREIERHGAGLVGPDTRDGLFLSLTRWLDLPVSSQSLMRARAKECFTAQFDARRIAEQMIQVVTNAPRAPMPTANVDGSVDAMPR